MSFLGGMLMAGVVVVLIGMVANLFLQLPALHTAISAVFILISSGAILFETSNIIRGGETNYIRATVSLYVSLYNIFVSLLSIWASPAGTNRFLLNRGLAYAGPFLLHCGQFQAVCEKSCLF